MASQAVPAISLNTPHGDVGDPDPAPQAWVITLSVSVESIQKTGTKSFMLPSEKPCTAIRDMARLLCRDLGGANDCPTEPPKIVLLGKHQPREFFLIEHDLLVALRCFDEGSYDAIEARFMYPPASDTSHPASYESYRAELRIQLHERSVLGVLSVPSVYNNNETRDTRHFIPIEDLCDVLTPVSIKKLFKEDAKLSPLLDARGSIIDEVVRDGRKLLATVVLGFADMGDLFSKFWKWGYRDEHMPFDLEDIPDFCKRDQYNDICNNQWQVLPVEFNPFNHFKQDGTYGEWSQQYILPFLPDSALSLGEGGFSEVFKVKVYPGHQTIFRTYDDNNPPLALKKMHTKHWAEASFKKEFASLHRLTSLGQHDHLIELITGYRHGNDYFLVFPLAECTLKECFEDDRVGDEAYMVWMLEQLSDLADGLNTIHGRNHTVADADGSASTMLAPGNAAPQNSPPTGYHHDLTPSNLLLFRKLRKRFDGLEAVYGRLQISDFGLSKLRKHTELTRVSQSVHTPSKRGTPDYGAPERDLPKDERRQTRAYDIWSFGCVVLEIMTWLLEGKDGLAGFRDRRSGPIRKGNTTLETCGFYEYDGDNAMLRKPVMDHIKDLKKIAQDRPDKNCIVDMMELILRCLKIDPRSRPDAGAIARDLRRIREAYPATSAGNGHLRYDSDVSATDIATDRSFLVVNLAPEGQHAA